MVQFGLAMMPLGGRIASSGLTSETTNGTSGSIRQAEELSITTPPAAATLGAMIRRSRLAVGEEREVETAEVGGCRCPPRGSRHPPTARRRPAERAEAKNRISLIGNRRSSSSVA